MTEIMTEMTTTDSSRPRLLEIIVEFFSNDREIAPESGLSSALPFEIVVFILFIISYPEWITNYLYLQK